MSRQDKRRPKYCEKNPRKCSCLKLNIFLQDRENSSGSVFTFFFLAKQILFYNKWQGQGGKGIRVTRRFPSCLQKHILKLFIVILRD